MLENIAHCDHCSAQTAKRGIQADSRFGSPTGVVRMGGRCLLRQDDEKGPVPSARGENGSIG